MLLLAQADDPAQSYGVEINPDKTLAITFGADDKVIVLAQN